MRQETVLTLLVVGDFDGGELRLTAVRLPVTHNVVEVWPVVVYAIHRLKTKTIFFLSLPFFFPQPTQLDRARSYLTRKLEVTSAWEGKCMGHSLAFPVLEKKCSLAKKLEKHK